MLPRTDHPLRHDLSLVRTACALCALLGCTDSGLVGRACEAGLCDDASSPGDAATAADSGPDADDDGGSSTCEERYAQCKLDNLEAFAYESCVRDALGCGAISEQQAVSEICSSRLGMCLMAGGLDPLQCQTDVQRCQMNPWGDGGVLTALDAGM